MRAVLRTIGGVHATQGNNAVPIPVSSNPEWNEVRHKPFNTISSTDFVVDNGELQLSTIPITDMDWDDIDNKPFESIGSGLTVSEGVLSANGGGGSITLDDKSLVTVDGKVQMAVPIYSETTTITPTYGPGLYLDTFSYPAGVDLDANFSAPNGFTLITGQSDLVYKVAMKLSDGTVFDGLWNADPSGSSYEYGGWGQWYTNDNSYELYIANEGSGQYRLHIYMNGDYINNGNVDALVLYQTEEVSGYDDLETICNENGLTYASITLTPRQETIYHKLPTEYYDQPSLEGYATQEYVDTYIYNFENKQFTQFGAGGGYIQSSMSGTYDITDITQVNNHYECNISYETDAQHPNYYVSVLEYSMDNHDWHATRLRIEYRVDVDITGSSPYLKISGLESILSSYSINEYNDYWMNIHLVFKDGVDISLINTQIYTQAYSSSTIDNSKQYINAFFIPVDNSTIKVDTDGNLATAIPAPPAANGTYTLQAVVNGSTITYSWI